MTLIDLGGRRVLAPGEVAPAPGMEPGDWVRIRVTDTGVGIEESVRPHLFEPFFTTRRGSGGTGLGLARVRDIVRRFDGRLTVQSTPAEGTTFVLCFPRRFDAASVRTPLPIRVRGGKDLGRVLIVDDDEVLRRSVARLLSSLGYEAWTAGDGEEALRILSSDGAGESMVAVISDLVMPTMDGLEFCRRLRVDFADLPLILVTGYPLDPQAAEVRESGASGWLEKPFSKHELADALSAAEAGARRIR